MFIMLLTQEIDFYPAGSVVRQGGVRFQIKSFLMEEQLC